MIRNKNIDWYRHLSFAAVGGFFAAYAVLLRMGVMANAQTLNLLELLISILRCNWLTAPMHVGAARSSTPCAPWCWCFCRWTCP